MRRPLPGSRSACRVLAGLLVCGAVLEAVAQPATFTIGEPGCLVLNPNPRRHERIQWSGGCKSGYADGTGVLLWYRDEALAQRYEGAMAGGQPEGIGTMSYSGGAARYEGGFHLGKRHGAGVLTYSNGMRLAASFDNGEPVGTVQVSGPQYTYEGGWLEGKPHGEGRAIYADGRYEGQFSHGLREGRGSASFANGNRYQGEWKANQPDGQGRMDFSDGSHYEGGWRAGRFHGEGVLTNSDGEATAGRWDHGKPVREPAS
ncbi:MAG TPA: hypothetical protein VJ743_08985 [Albitalea sp.]|nr:hypothetical protein [Albitalea sp.]